MLEDDATKRAINEGLANNSNYRLVLTGHSLGAGIASLLTLMLHSNHALREANAAEGRDIRCFGYGCPPVFVSTEENGNTNFIEKAFNNTVCFINSEDVIPHMSLDAIRRLAELLKRVHAALNERSQDLESIVKNAAADLQPIPGAERLKVPGKFVVWMSKAANGKKSDIVLCEPSKVSNLGFCLMGNLNDHLPNQYELSFNDLHSSE